MQPGYRSSSYAGDCSKCPEQGAAIASTFFISLLLLGFIFLAFYFVWSSDSGLNLTNRAQMYVSRRIRREAVRKGRISQSELTRKDSTVDEETAADKQENRIDEMLRNTQLYDPSVVFTPEMRMPTKFTYNFKIVIGFMQVGR